MINQDFLVAKDTFDANGFKIATEVVPQPDVSSTHKNERTVRSLKILV